MLGCWREKHFVQLFLDENASLAGRKHFSQRDLDAGGNLLVTPPFSG